jgi:hypothetical protein
MAENGKMLRNGAYVLRKGAGVSREGHTIIARLTISRGDVVWRGRKEQRIAASSWLKTHLENGPCILGYGGTVVGAACVASRHNACTLPKAMWL